MFQVPVGPETPLLSTEYLVAALGKDPDSFLGRLLSLCCKADGINLHRLRKGFPAEVALYELWQTTPVPEGRAAPTLQDLRVRYFVLVCRAMVPIEVQRELQAHYPLLLAAGDPPEAGD